jgi:hypothetical protein
MGCLDGCGRTPMGLNAAGGKGGHAEPDGLRAKHVRIDLT